MRKQAEKKLSHMIAEFLSLQYPKLVYRFDIGADIKLTERQQGEVKNKLRHKRGYPDLFIAEPCHGYHGLYIELKKSKSEIYKKDCSYKKKKIVVKKRGVVVEVYDHIEEQVKMHNRLRAKGYQVVWGLGFDDTINKIREYFQPVGKDKLNENQKELF